MRKTTLLVLLALSLSQFTAHAQDDASANCGVNSAIALAKILGSTTDARAELKAKYPTAIVSFLDVKQMCLQAGIKTSGVKATFDELLAQNTPCIIGLKDPDHFTVLLDGTKTEVRVLDGESAAIQVVPRKDLEVRYTGVALLPDVAIEATSPQFTTPKFDQYMVFNGLDQKAEYRFPITNKGKTPLSVEIAGTSCGCTAAILSGKDSKVMTLLPNQTQDVVVSYHVQTQAPIQQSVTLKTNDPRRGEIYLTIRGQLPPELLLSPPALYIEQRKGEEPNKSFKVIGPKGTEVQRVWSDLPYLHLQTNKPEDEDVRVLWPVSVEGFAKAPAGRIDGKIYVLMKDGKKLWVQVRGEIEGSDLPGLQEAALLPRAEDDHAMPMGSPLPTVKVGQRIPNFLAADFTGKTWSASKLRRKNILLTFFSKCFTGGCATQLSSLRDQMPHFAKANMHVLAVSVDKAEVQNRFYDQWKLNFPLLPDTQRKLCKLFGAVQNSDERAARMTILIDKDGIVRWIDRNVNVKTHVADVLKKMRELGMAK